MPAEYRQQFEKCKKDLQLMDDRINDIMQTPFDPVEES